MLVVLSLALVGCTDRSLAPGVDDAAAELGDLEAADLAAGVDLVGVDHGREHLCNVAACFTVPGGQPCGVDVWFRAQTRAGIEGPPSHCYANPAAPSLCQSDPTNVPAGYPLLVAPSCADCQAIADACNPRGDL